MKNLRQPPTTHNLLTLRFVELSGFEPKPWINQFGAYDGLDSRRHRRYVARRKAKADAKKTKMKSIKSNGPDAGNVRPAKTLTNNAIDFKATRDFFKRLEASHG